MRHLAALLIFVVGTLIIACELPNEPKPDAESCVFVKQAYWLSTGHRLPVPESLMRSDVWNIDTRWWLGDETTRFSATTDGCLVVNH